MWKEIKELLKLYFESHFTRKIGFLLGVFLGILILIFGPLQTFFLLFCGVVGLYVGSRFDDEDDLVGRTLRMLERVLPERFQRW
ncbi:MAG: DUF2273 domain-containing protein [Selenomonadaceae bacterium]|nr:DUF2273 domain-containing protein [Selenomonadaceae bacterium]